MRSMKCRTSSFKTVTQMVFVRGAWHLVVEKENLMLEFYRFYFRWKVRGLFRAKMGRPSVCQEFSVRCFAPEASASDPLEFALR
jgi:hypothetical protein